MCAASYSIQHAECCKPAPQQQTHHPSDGAKRHQMSQGAPTALEKCRASSCPASGHTHSHTTTQSHRTIYPKARRPLSETAEFPAAPPWRRWHTPIYQGAQRSAARLVAPRCGRRLLAPRRCCRRRARRGCREATPARQLRYCVCILCCDMFSQGLQSQGARCNS